MANYNHQRDSSPEQNEEMKNYFESQFSTFINEQQTDKIKQIQHFKDIQLNEKVMFEKYYMLKRNNLISDKEHQFNMQIKSLDMKNTIGYHYTVKNHSTDKKPLLFNETQRNKQIKEYILQIKIAYEKLLFANKIPHIIDYSNDIYHRFEFTLVAGYITTLNNYNHDNNLQR